MKELLRIAVLASWNAGKEIMNVYKSEFTFQSKDDKSPLTEADLKSHAAIKDALGSTVYPILSEEGKMIDFEERKNWETFWLIDPLDGTKEFIKRNGEFTVNIALVKSGKPILGVIYVPVTKKMYFGYEGFGSFCFEANDDLNENVDQRIMDAQKIPLNNPPTTYTIVSSRTHSSPETEVFIKEKEEKYGDINLVNAGSSLKLCLVAEGKANVYPRLAPTMEWDTAAGHAIVTSAGGRVYNFETKEELKYNKENLLNPFFVVELGS